MKSTSRVHYKIFETDESTHGAPTHQDKSVSFFIHTVKRIQVPASLPDIVLKEGWERSFAYWILAKHKFKNSTIYGFSLRRIGEVLGISHEAARHHYKVWVKNGLVRHHCGNITFLGWDAMLPIAARSTEKRYSRKICLLVHDNIADQVKNIQSRIIIKNINQQVRNFKVKKEITAMLGLAKRKRHLTREEGRAYKKALKDAKKFKKPEIFNEEVYLSDRSISNLLGVSLSTAKKVKAYIKEAGLIELAVMPGKMVGERMCIREYATRSEVDSRFNDTFYWKGYAYTYPKTIVIGSGMINMASLCPKHKVEVQKVDTLK